MGRGKTPSATKLLANIKEAEDFQKVDSWYDNCKRLTSYLQGDYGQQMYNTRYIINTIYNLLNLIIPNLYFQNPYIIVAPTKPFFLKKTDEGTLKIDGWKRAKLCETVLNQEIKRIGFKNEVTKVIQDALLCGMGIAKVGRSGSSIHDENTDYLDDGDIFFQRLSVFDYLYDPMSTAPENARFEVHRYIDTLDNVKNNKMLIGTSDLEGTSLSDGAPKKDKKEKSKDGCKWVELFEYHDHENDKVAILTRDGGGKKRKLYYEDKKYEFKGSDFNRLKFTSDNDTFVGIPPLLMVEDEALALNEIVTLTVNHLQRFAGVILHEEGALDNDDIERFEYGVQGDMLQTQPGALTQGRVRRESPLSMGADYYNNFNLFTSSIDRTLGIPDFQRSTQSGKRKTAQEIQVAASDANNRRGYFVSYVKDFVTGSVYKINSLMQQFYDEKRWTNMHGDHHEWVEWTREDIAGEYTFDFDIEDIKAYSASKANALMQSIQMMAPLEIFRPVWQKIDPFKLADQIFKNMDINLKSIEKGEDLAHYEHDPYKENELLLDGKHIMDPYPDEPHEDHINLHYKVVVDAQNNKNEEVIQETMRHISMHKYWQQILPAMAGQPQTMGIQGSPGQPGMPASGGTPPPGGQPPGGPGGEPSDGGPPPESFGI